MKRLLIMVAMNIVAHSMCMERTIIMFLPKKNAESSLEKDRKKAAYLALENKDIETFRSIIRETNFSLEGQEDVLMKVINKKDNISLDCCLKYGFNLEGLGRERNYLYNPLESCVMHNNAPAVKMLLQTNCYNVYKVKSSFEYAQRLGYHDCVKELKDTLQIFFISALKKHSCKKVRYLVKAGVDVNQVIDDKISLDYATEVGCKSCIQLLTDYKS